MKTINKVASLVAVVALSACGLNRNLTEEPKYRTEVKGVSGSDVPKYLDEIFYRTLAQDDAIHLKYVPPFGDEYHHGVYRILANDYCFDGGKSLLECADISAGSETTAIGEGKNINIELCFKDSVDGLNYISFIGRSKSDRGEGNHSLSDPKISRWNVYDNESCNCANKSRVLSSDAKKRDVKSGYAMELAGFVAGFAIQCAEE